MAGPEQFGRLNIWAMLKAMLNNEVAIFVYSGVPVSGIAGTFFDKAGKGSLLIDYLNGELYMNTGTKLSPTWTQLADVNQVVTLPINLVTQVTGDLPLSNLAPSAAASRLLGRGSAGGAGDWEPLTLGANLTITGTVLAAAGGAGFTLSPVTVQSGDGALDPNTDARYVITKGSIAALTLAAPSNPASDGKTIVVTSNTAFAHTLTTATLMDQGRVTTTSAVFAAFAGASITLMAYAGRWKVISDNVITYT